MENLKKWATSWIGITIAFIAFWPIGFVFLYLRWFTNGGKLKAKANSFWGLAIFFYILGAGFILILPDYTGAEAVSILIFMIIFLALGGLFSLLALKEGKNFKYYTNYADYISARRNVTVEELAEKMRKTPEKVLEDITKVFGYKMLEGYISEDNEIIIIRKEENNNNYTIQEKKQVTIIKCKNCGASNKFVVGKENRCEYCDSLLHHN